MPNHLARPQALVARRAALFLAGLFATAIAAQRADAELLYVTTGTGSSVVTYDISLGSAVAVQASGATFVSLSGNANGITIDSANNVYVLEVVNPLNNTTLKKFNQSGTLLTSFAATDGPNNYADEGLAVRPNGNILGVNQGGDVLEFNSTGTPVRTFGIGNLSTPVGIALDGSGNSYVANSGGTTISKFAADGTFTSNLVTTNLSFPEGVAIRGGSLYVTNAGDSTVSVFNLLDGSFQQSITGNMSFPVGIGFDSAGNFYVANPGDTTISKFNSSGVHQFSWTHAAGGTPQFLAVAPVPEPTAMGLAVSGLVCGGYMLRRRRAAHSQARQRAA
jgi:sugar lactone lactonase YvrE